MGIKIKSLLSTALLIVLFALLLLVSCLEQKYSGIAVQPYPAPEFTLTDQFGRQTALSDFGVKVVVMSFVYTNCPTVCPIITANFVSAARMLGEDASKEVVFIGITVDPERDKPEVLRKYVDDKGLKGRMYFLTGKRSELEKVWNYYNVFVNRSEADASGNYTIDHTAIVYVLDRKGRLRILYPGIDWYPKFLVQDVEKLLREERLVYRIVYDVPE